MHSASTKRRPLTLVGRVALVAGLAAVGGGFFAAIAAVTLAEAKVERAEDRRLHEEALEILYEASTLRGNALEELVEAERKELERMGLRVAIRRDGVLFGGDSTLPIHHGGCATVKAPMDEAIDLGPDEGVREIDVQRHCVRRDCSPRGD